MSIRAGAAILELLEADTNLMSEIEGRIFPIMAMEDTAYPYIAYRRKNLIPAYTKESHSVEDSVYIDIAIVSSSYGQTLKITNDVLRVLDRRRGTYAGVEINDIRLSDSEEEAADAYMQRLEFEIFINKLR